MQFFGIVSKVLLIGATQAARIALVTYFNLEHSVAITSSIVFIGTAAIEVSSQFLEE